MLRAKRRWDGFHPQLKSLRRWLRERAKAELNETEAQRNLACNRREPMP